MEKKITILTLFTFIFLLACCSAKKEITIPDLQEKILTPELAVKLLKPAAVYLKSPVKCAFEQNGKSNNLYGDLEWRKDKLKLKLYSAMNYARIEIECDSQNIKAEINGKTCVEDLNKFDKQKILEFIELLIARQTDVSEKDIEFIVQEDTKSVFKIWNKINLEIDKKSQLINSVYYENVAVFYENFYNFKSLKIPLKIKIISVDPENSFTADIKFAKNKLYAK
ncbi:MAG TPA: hypothetical protein PKY81_13065 [bacterium]|nr:hypothetical protein [bacterium]HPN31877.1 hypothetical protein [bacterium]